MKLQAQTSVIMVDLITGEQASFYISELMEYKQQYIVYGETKSHQAKTYRGIVDLRGRPARCVVLPSEKAETIGKLVNILGGRPLAFIQDETFVIGDMRLSGPGVDLLYVLNMGTLKGFWDGDIYDKANMIEGGKRMIDLYWDWKGAGYKLPQWFVDIRNKAREAK